MYVCSIVLATQPFLPRLEAYVAEFINIFRTDR